MKKILEPCVDTEFLQSLIDNSKMSRRQLSLATDVQISSIQHILHGDNTDPSIRTLIKLADFFGVSVDSLLGRSDEDTKKELLQNSKDFIKDKKRLCYEAYLKTFDTNNQFKKIKYAAPWPYNIFEAVNGEPIDWIISKKQLESLEQMVKTFSESEQSILKMYFCEEKTLEEIGLEMHCTRERIRQRIAKTITKLKTPAFKATILAGTFQNVKEIQQKIDELDAKSAVLQKQMDDFDALKNKFIQDFRELQKNYSPPPSIQDQNLISFDLDARACNCLARAGIMTAGQLLDLVNQPNGEQKIRSLRQVGEKSFQNIMQLVSKLRHSIE